MPIKTLLLPGLDGTGKLLDHFAQAAPKHMSCEIIRYEKHLATLDDFVAVAASKLTTKTKTVIVAESFSGPIAAQLAFRFPERIAAIVFAASFVIPPNHNLLKLARFIPANFFRNISSRGWLVKKFCLNDVRDKSIINEGIAVVASLEPDVIQRRLMMLSQTAPSKTCVIPTLDLRAMRDRIVSLSSAASVAQVFVNATTVKIDAPHFLLLSRPEECWIAIEKFLAGLSLREQRQMPRTSHHLSSQKK